MTPSNTAFDELYRTWHSQILGYLLKLLGNQAAAEDCAQETFLRAFRSWQIESNIHHTSSWLRTIARNVAADYVKRERKQGSHTIDDLPFHAPRWNGPRDDVRELRSALVDIDSRDAASFVLHHVHGYSEAEIAAAHKISSRTVKRRLAAARSALAAALTSLVLLFGMTHSLNPRTWFNHFAEAAARCFSDYQQHGFGGLGDCAWAVVADPEQGSKATHSSTAPTLAP